MNDNTTPNVVITQGTKPRDNTLALDITEVAQARLQRRYPIRPGGGTTETKESDPRDPRRLLRTRPEWPGRRGAEKRDERAARHSITSSARPSNVIGTVRPSALAVLRLMISSTFVDCWTGRSAGFSPLRIRPVYTPAWRYESIILPP